MNHSSIEVEQSTGLVDYGEGLASPPDSSCPDLHDILIEETEPVTDPMTDPFTDRESVIHTSPPSSLQIESSMEKKS